MRTGLYPDSVQVPTRPFRQRHRFLAVFLTLLFSLQIVTALKGQTQGDISEYEVKAAYLFNFLKFVEWPDDPAVDPHGKWVIGFVGDSRVGDELTRLVEGKMCWAATYK
jgi:hypothetical protein